MIRALILTGLLLPALSTPPPQQRQAVVQDEMVSACRSAAGPEGTVIHWTGVIHDVGAGAGPHVLASVHRSSSTGGPPTVSLHAINTKGTGTDKGRVSAPSSGGAPVSCDLSTEASSRVSACSLSGDASAPTVSLDLLLPAWTDGGVTHEDSWEVSIVARDASTGPDVTRIACTGGFSTERGTVSRASYDLAVAKKV